MKFMSIYTGPDSKSHFRDVEVEFKDVGKERKSMMRSALMKATGAFFQATGTDYEIDWHSAPRRQLIITLEGEVDIVASDGTMQRFGPGDIMLAEDTTGKGHTSRAVNNRPRKALVVTLE